MASVSRVKGKWRARWRDSEGRQHEKWCATKREAELVAAASHADVARGVALVSSDETLVAFAGRWSQAQTWRPSSRSSFDAHRRHIAEHFGTMRPRDVRPLHVQALVADLTARGYSPATVEAVLRRLSSILRAAVREGLASRNAADGVRPPRDERGPAERAAALTPDQVRSLLAILPGDYVLLGKVIVATGMRPSEAAGLTVDRVDFLRRRVTVDRQLRSDGTQGPVKTPASRRVVPLPAALVEPLSRQAGEYGDGLLLRSSWGSPLIRQRYSHAWRTAVARLGRLDEPVLLPEGARGFHALRHTFVSLQLAAGTDVATIARMIGHATPAETLATYSHMLEGRDDEAADVVAVALGL